MRQRRKRGFPFRRVKAARGEHRRDKAHMADIQHIVGTDRLQRADSQKHRLRFRIHVLAADRLNANLADFAVLPAARRHAEHVFNIVELARFVVRLRALYNTHGHVGLERHQAPRRVRERDNGLAFQKVLVFIIHVVGFKLAHAVLAEPIVLIKRAEGQLDFILPRKAFQFDSHVATSCW